MHQTQDTNLNDKKIFDDFHQVREELSSLILGQETLMNEVLSCLLASGHILITGAPGLAKTTIVKTLSRFLGLSFGRIQFTPDLLPTDITGSDVLNLNKEKGEPSFTFQKGPIFANIILADEINRASPRTQSALLEAMQEKKVTFGSKVHSLPEPFIVCATQNPFESEGVFPLPEAQLDRFLLHSIITYPSKEDELKVFEHFSEKKLPSDQQEVKNRLTKEKLDALSKESQGIPISGELIEVIYDLINLTRKEAEQGGKLVYGAGTRAGMSLIATSKSLAFIEGKKSVAWSHIQRLIKPCLRHRIKISPEAYFQGETEDSLVDDILEKTKASLGRKVKGL